MIAANELRIGNWVIDGKTKSIVIVDGLQFTGRIVTADDSCDDYKRGIHPEPIPLTPEILEKCGLERTIGTLMVNKIECAEFYFVKHFYSKITQDSIDRNWFDVTHNYSCDESNEEELLCSVRHLHQLQNLYWCLTGEELEVKL